MRVVFINPGHDTAGVGIAMKQAFDACTDWEARAICRSQTYLDYPTDIVWDARFNNKRTGRTVNEIVNGSDVVHAMNSPRPLGWFQFRPSQIVVVHHLGSNFRREPEATSTVCREYGAVEVTDSIDLLFDHVGWLPVPADLDALAQLRSERYESSKRIRIAHAPTDREYKDTEAVLDAMESLSRKYAIDFDLIEGVTNRKCLARKATADIFIDQLKYGFGVNAIECWAMGIPVVSGLADQTAKKRGMAMWGGALPWADATQATLESVIEHLIVNEQWRTELGERGRAHADLWHSQASVVAQALRVYGEAGLEIAA